MSSLYQIYLDGLKRLRGIETPEDFADFAAANGKYLVILGILGVLASVSFIGGLIVAFDSKELSENCILKLLFLTVFILFFFKKYLLYV